MVFQRASDMQHDQGGDRPGGDFVRQHGVGEQRRVGRGDVRDDEEIEELGRHRQRRRRDDEPAGENRANRQDIERRLGGRREPPLPAGETGAGGEALTRRAASLNAGTYTTGGGAPVTFAATNGETVSGALILGQDTTFGQPVTLGGNTTLNSSAGNHAITLAAVSGAVDTLSLSTSWVRSLSTASPSGTSSNGHGTRLEVVSHGGDVRLLAALAGPVRNRVARAIAARAAVWTFVSEPLRLELLATLSPPARSDVERIAAGDRSPLEMPDVSDAVARLRRELGATRTAVSVGRLVAAKRVDLAIEHVARTRDVDALVVVGDGPERTRLEQLARALGVDARFVGAVGALFRALASIGAADALLHASTAEGLSTVVREAEALGTPVVRI